MLRSHSFYSFQEMLSAQGLTPSRPRVRRQGYLLRVSVCSSGHILSLLFVTAFHSHISSQLFRTLQVIHLKKATCFPNEFTGKAWDM